MSRGRQPSKRLTYKKVRQAGPGRYSDGRGLRLIVLDRGGLRLWRYWSQRLVVLGKRRDLGIGSVDDVTLGEAREMAEKNQKIARRGGDPCVEAAHEKNATFAQMYEVVTENRSKNWKTPGTGAGAASLSSIGSIVSRRCSASQIFRRFAYFGDWPLRTFLIVSCGIPATLAAVNGPIPSSSSLPAIRFCSVLWGSPVRGSTWGWIPGSIPDGSDSPWGSDSF